MCVKCYLFRFCGAPLIQRIYLRAAEQWERHTRLSRFFIEALFFMSGVQSVCAPFFCLVVAVIVLYRLSHWSFVWRMFKYVDASFGWMAGEFGRELSHLCRSLGRSSFSLAA